MIFFLCGFRLFQRFTESIEAGRRSTTGRPDQKTTPAHHGGCRSAAVMLRRLSKRNLLSYGSATTSLRVSPVLNAYSSPPAREIHKRSAAGGGQLRAYVQGVS